MDDRSSCFVGIFGYVPFGEKFQPLTILQFHLSAFLQIGGNFSWPQATSEANDFLTLNPIKRIPTNQSCDGFDGILHIAMGGIGGAAGTNFFQFVVGQIIYAEENNLKPWVHMNHMNKKMYDPVVHNRSDGVHLTAMVGRTATMLFARPKRKLFPYPGPLNTSDPIHSETLHFRGTGIWEHYFQVFRSSNTTAVFEMASHYRTDHEILIEILALSHCQFLINGLSAVTESAIWINFDLHNRSVNLEDPDHHHADAFGTMVRQGILDPD